MLLRSMGFYYASDSKSSKTVYLADRQDPKGQENPVCQDRYTVERALDLVIADAEIRNMLLSAKGRANIDDVYGRLAR